MKTNITKRDFRNLMIGIATGYAFLIVVLTFPAKYGWVHLGIVLVLLALFLERNR